MRKQNMNSICYETEFINKKHNICMPEKIMKTLWDESSDLESETESTRSVVSDNYTSGDIKDLRETIENEDIEGGIVDDTIKE